ncbi:glucans biosynthesis glucosyltransferase MdoH [Roseimaritima ulvae]|uniref:Glucans biosynthesis glucosyltransferase H n=1 Tax=Roseimaritima ulvae TaxID=980254 RepID=A0A5B9QY00_9BACT|nr:glucans biosynthesis glucosyltransferase MdoH [Roseimaritima ulvae]QEG41976.1 Glucans biosynthesis glucosyltransferase H [Roseimaritima ulvae]
MDGNNNLQVSTTTQVRTFVVIATVGMTVVGTFVYWMVVASRGGVNLFEALTIPFFAVLFGWITFSFWLATVGFFSLARQRHRVTSGDSHCGEEGDREPPRTAVLMPIYNEAPERVLAGIEAMVRDLEAHQQADRFDFYVLSDSTQPEVWLREELVWSQVQERLGERCRLFYRHRPHNSARKAGNIADFCSRWGSGYPFMIVLDADSLVSADTMIEMVARMNADPQLGILQVPPTPTGRSSLFARLQQFAAQAYGPVFVEGFNRWAGDEGNYWGHNAIIRVQAFLRHCDLPKLPGKAPLGGEILSHDFVEAALMLRAGWKVRLATDLSGSYEECPTTLADYAQRDQRWCQGNLQHTKLLVAENFRLLSRFHFASGVLAYTSSPIWLAFTLLCVMGMLVERGGHQVGSRIPFQPIDGALVLFCVSLTLLLLPKAWSVALTLGRFGGIKPVGGRLKFAFSCLLETLASIVLSPIMALFHSRFVIATLTGTNVPWSSQQRNEQTLSWREASRQFASFTVFGLACTGLLWWWMPELLIWFAPLLIGLLAAIPIAKAAASIQLGKGLQRLGLLLIEEETDPPPVLQYLQQALAAADDDEPTPADGLFERFVTDIRLHALHQRIQRASAASVRIKADDLRTAMTAVATEGVGSIPENLRAPLLKDDHAFLDLHVEVQWRGGQRMTKAASVKNAASV